MCLQTKLKNFQKILNYLIILKVESYDEKTIPDLLNNDQFIKNDPESDLLSNDQSIKKKDHKPIEMVTGNNYYKDYFKKLLNRSRIGNFFMSTKSKENFFMIPMIDDSQNLWNTTKILMGVNKFYVKSGHRFSCQENIFHVLKIEMISKENLISMNWK